LLLGDITKEQRHRAPVIFELDPKGEPEHDGRMNGGAELEQHLDALYVAVRDGAAVDRQAAFDIAVNELESRPLDAETRELAEASVADDDETRLASAAAAFLDACGYEPGFEQAPERLARLARALNAVRADMRATGLTGEVRLVRPDWSPGNAAVETWAGDQGWTSGISSSEAADDLSALVTVAEQARQAIMESLRYQSTGKMWPSCPVHGLGTSPQARHGTGVWWCDGGNGHVAAEIGHWSDSS
jgi:GNAT superfamily N-acetyltransferase